MLKRFAGSLLVGSLVVACNEGVLEDEHAPDPSVATYSAGLVPGRPTGIAPIGGTNPTPVFQWQVNDAESAEFQLWINDATGTNITGGPPNVLFSAAQAGCETGAFPRTCSLTSAQVGVSLAGGDGQWWVRGRHLVDGFGPWSPGLRFTVGCGTPTLVAPTGVVTNPTPTYEWQALDGISEYRIWVRDSVSNPVIDQTFTPAQVGCAGGAGGPNCTFAPTTSVAPGQVTWWVQTCAQDWSAAANFTYDATCPGGCDDGNPCTDDTCVAGACQNTDNTAICDDTNACTTGDICQNGLCEATDQAACTPAATGPSGAGIGYNPTFTWNETSPPVATYRLWINDCTASPVFDQVVTATTVCAGGTCSYNPGITLSNGIVRWWVQSPPHTDGMDGSFLAHGPWSPTTQGSNGITEQVMTISPSGLVATSTPTFTWNAIAGQDHTYQLWITDSLGTDYMFDTTEAAAGCAGGGVCSLSPGQGLPSGVATFWVKANYQCQGSNIWSVGRSFTVP